jgi:hypothetical protein
LFCPGWKEVERVQKKRQEKNTKSYALPVLEEDAIVHSHLIY